MKHLELRPGLYRDSVRLMQLSSSLAALPGITAAQVGMATPVNLELLATLGFECPPASPDAMLVALDAQSPASLDAALAQLEAELSSAGGAGRRAGGPGGIGSVGVGGGYDGGLPRTTGSAVARARTAGTATLVLVSTPGASAFVEARDALDAGANVMIFSDNVPVAEEVALKTLAAERELLVLGPDCGTAVIGGVGLGFANVVRPGPVGLVAASGTGAQQVMALLDRAGVGISHCLGVGGRDLSAEVAGRSAAAALRLLATDADTELILLIAKPAALGVAEALDAQIAGLGTPVLIGTLGPGRPDLAATTAAALAHLGRPVPTWPAWGSEQPTSPGAGLRGLYSGGTLALEALSIADALGPVESNLGAPAAVTARGGHHRVLDLGADEYTLGRPHPMIDLGPRRSLLAEEAADAMCGVLLLDVVLGHGAHPDPASQLGPAIAQARSGRPDLAVVVCLVGTRDDPQGFDAQCAALTAAGARVFAANADAARYAVSRVAIASRTVAS